MGGKNPQKGRKDQLNLFIQPRCVSVVAFVFLIELSNFLLGSIRIINTLLVYMYTVTHFYRTM